ncbi:Fe(3+)-hydroxamate ABC transporter permease FhuB [Cobetia sp. UCD-24C]|uniref:Fe(3+)-hydroxamate ABC transporter permease FhuB n=1 Tax=Cobetia sp. UCD-24C TaxID=1716176 RepID=UPI000ABC57BF|nr:Fe(3+)-hydroxamate ABC transporter permease FhuB [Cobetia sp. UCD-24C]
MATTEQAMSTRPASGRRPLHLTPGRACSLLALSLVVLGSFALNREGLSLTQGLTALWASPDFSAAASLGQADSALLSAQLVAHVSWWPRLVCALLAGGALGMAGVLMQQVLRNPLAAPTTLGVASGASLAMMLATLFAPALMAGTGLGGDGFQLGREWVALAGGLAAMGLVFALAWARGMSPTVVVLAGLVVNLYIGALGMVLLLFNQEALHGTLVWGAGSLAQNSWDGVITLLTRLLPGMLLALVLMRPLAVLDLDEANARSLGVSLRRLRLMSLGLAVFLSACVVSVLGIIGFIGLAAPACVRLMGARRLGQRLLWAPLFGALLLAVTDQVVASLDGLLPNLIPTGAMTAALGAPLLLWLIPRLKLAQGAGPASHHGMSLTHRHPRPDRLIGWLLAGVCVALMLALLVGNGADGWTLGSDMLQQLLAGQTSVLDFRLPRVLAAAGAGVLLALAGTLLQRLTSNPMASPEILGISGGTAIALMLTLLLVPSPGQLTLLGAGICGALACLALLVVLNHRSGFIPERVLLCGVAITALYDAVRGIILADGDPRGQQILAWLSGSTYYVGLSAAVGVLALAIIAVLLVRPLARWLDILPLGMASASALGIGVTRARLVLLGAVAVLTALATLIVGPLSFVGLLAPHLARLLGLSRAREHMLGAVLCGALLMVLADWLGRQLLSPYEIPAGLMASLIGGSYFLWSLRRS